MKMAGTPFAEYHGSEDVLRGKRCRWERELLLATDCATDCRVATARCDTGKNGVKPGARRGPGSVSSSGDDHGALRARGIPLEAEFASDSDRELFRVPVTDRPAHSFFPRGRKTIWCAAFGAFRVADCRSRAPQFLGRYAIPMDDDLACGGGVVPDRSAFCGIGVCGSASGLAARREKDIKREGDRLKSAHSRRKTG
jgi:hypothetical protein